MEVKWKSEKDAQQLRNEIRKEVIDEVRAICKDCKQLNVLDKEEYRKTAKKRNGVWKG